MIYLDENGIISAFAEHLKQYSRPGDDLDKMILESGFPDTYSCSYLSEEIYDDVSIDGTLYEKRICTTNFGKAYYYIPEFRFYIYYRLTDIPERIPRNYIRSRKLYCIFE